MQRDRPFNVGRGQHPPSSGDPVALEEGQAGGAVDRLRAGPRPVPSLRLGSQRRACRFVRSTAGIERYESHRSTAGHATAHHTCLF